MDYHPKTTPADDPINWAATMLPDGWEIKLQVERHGGAIKLLNQVGEKVEFPSNCERWQDEVRDAVEHAIAVQSQQDQRDTEINALSDTY